LAISADSTSESAPRTSRMGQEGRRRRLAPFGVVKPLTLQDDRSILMHIEF